jgi:hypothetical protein
VSRPGRGVVDEETCPIVRARGCSAGLIGTGFLSSAPPKFPAGPIRSRPWRLGPQPGAYKYGAHFVNLQPSTVAKRLARHFTFGRSRVLTPVPPDQVWVFFRGFPTPSHRGMSHITDKANAGPVSTSQYLPPSFRTHPHRTHPESSRQCG